MIEDYTWAETHGHHGSRAERASAAMDLVLPIYSDTSNPRSAVRSALGIGLEFVALVVWIRHTVGVDRWQQDSCYCC